MPPLGCTASVLTPIADMAEEWRLRIAMIERAQHFLYSTTYFLQHDRFGKEYIAALKAAASRGVRVFLLIDGFGQKLAGALMTPEEKTSVRAATSTLREAGARVEFYRCARLPMRLLGSGMHIKIQLSDQGGALFSSGNISATSYDKWREFSLYLEGEITLRLLAELHALGIPQNPADSAHLAASQPSDQPYDLDYISHNPTLDTHPLNPIFLRAPNPLTDHLIARINAATQRVWLTSLYFKPEPRLLAAVLKAAQRGVDVQIFHGHRTSLGASVLPWMPAYKMYPSLLSAGVKIFEQLRGEHAKFLLIDTNTAIIGSYNLEYMAHDRLAEAVVHSRSPQMIETLEREFAARRACPGTQAITHTKIPTALRAKLLLFWPFARWL